MKRYRILSLLSLLLALPAAAMALYLGLTALHRSPKLVRLDPGARAAAQQLVDCLNSGRLEDCGLSLQGTPELILPDPRGDGAEALLWRHYRVNLSAALAGDPYLDGQGYVQDISVSVPNLDALTQHMKTLTPGLLDARVAQAEDPAELYDDARQLRQTVVDQVLRQAARQAIAQPETLLDCRVRVRLVYEKGQWWILPNQGLLEILSGKME